MADTAAVAPAPAKKKAAAKPKKPAAHPKYSEMIKAAVSSLKERGGSSRQAILKYILANYKVGDEKSANSHLKLALRAGVKNGSLKQSKGTGASGSFRLGEVKKEKPAKKAAKPKAAKPKKSPKKAKKPAKKTAAKKPAAKKAAKPKKAKTPKKPAAKKASKSPKKAKASKPKKAKTPKKKA
ncbi:MAG: histone H1/H5 family protein, partial [Sedimenticola sp.]